MGTARRPQAISHRQPQGIHETRRGERERTSTAGGKESSLVVAAAVALRGIAVAVRAAAILRVRI